MSYDDARTLTEPYFFMLDGEMMDANVTASNTIHFIPPNPVIHFFENCDKRISGVIHKSKAPNDAKGKACKVHITLSGDNVIIVIEDRDGVERLFDCVVEI